MWPIKTYLDMADDTYARGEPIEERRKWGHIIVYDSNTVGKDYLCIKVTSDLDADEQEHGLFGAHIRLHKGQVKMLIRALEKFVKDSEVI